MEEKTLWLIMTQGHDWCINYMYEEWKIVEKKKWPMWAVPADVGFKTIHLP